MSDASMRDWAIKRANKDYKCSRCAEKIEKGDLYEYMAWVQGLGKEFHCNRNCYKHFKITEDEYLKHKKIVDKMCENGRLLLHF